MGIWIKCRNMGRIKNKDKSTEDIKMKKYFRLDVIEDNEIISVLTTNNYEEACRQYDAWKEHGKAVALFEINI